MSLRRRIDALAAAIPPAPIQVSLHIDTGTEFLADWMTRGYDLADSFTPPPDGWSHWEHHGPKCRRCVAASAARGTMLTIALVSIEESPGGDTLTISRDEWRARGRWWPEADDWNDDACTTRGEALDALSGSRW